MRSADRISLQPAQIKIPALFDRPGDFLSLRRGTRSRAMIADVEINQKVDRLRSCLLEPGNLRHMIHDGHRSNRADASHLRGIRDRRSQQDARNAVVSHQFRFCDGSDGDPRRSMRDLTPRNLDALVRLGVRAQLLPRLLHTLRHAREIPFEKIGVQQQRGRGNLTLFEQPPLYEL